MRRGSADQRVHRGPGILHSHLDLATQDRLVVPSRRWGLSKLEGSAGIEEQQVVVRTAAHKAGMAALQAARMAEHRWDRRGLRRLVCRR